MVTVGPRQGQGALVGSDPPIFPFIAWLVNLCGARLRLLQMQLRVHAAASESALASPADDSSSAVISSPAASTAAGARGSPRAEASSPPAASIAAKHVAVCHVRIMMVMAPKWSSSTPVSRTMCPTQRLLLRRPVMPGRLSTSLHT